MKARADSQLHYGERSFVSCQQENEQEGVKLLALGSGALLLERKNVSLSTTLAATGLWRVMSDQGHRLVNDAPASVFPLVYALILIF